MSYRRIGDRSPIEQFDIAHPDLPPSLEGLRIMHVTDLHVRRPRRSDRGDWRATLDSVRAEPVDLLALTGDWCDTVGQERAAAACLADIVGACKARLGAFGVFGNHDNPHMRRIAGDLPGVRWMEAELTAPLRCGPGDRELPLRILGLSWPEDPLRALLGIGRISEFVLALAHAPSLVLPLAEFGVPLVLAGHTHGGQIRLGTTFSPHTSCDLPGHMASGLLQSGRTLCAVSRGMGDGVADGLRIACPPQVPIYTLRVGAEPPPASGSQLHRIKRW